MPHLKSVSQAVSNWHHLNMSAQCQHCVSSVICQECAHTGVWNVHLSSCYRCRTASQPSCTSDLTKYLLTVLIVPLWPWLSPRVHITVSNSECLTEANLSAHHVTSHPITEWSVTLLLNYPHCLANFICPNTAMYSEYHMLYSTHMQLLSQLSYFMSVLHLLSRG